MLRDFAVKICDEKRIVLLVNGVDKIASEKQGVVNFFQKFFIGMTGKNPK